MRAILFISSKLSNPHTAIFSPQNGQQTYSLASAQNCALEEK